MMATPHREDLLSGHHIETILIQWPQPSNPIKETLYDGQPIYRMLSDGKKEISYNGPHIKEYF